MSGQRIAPQGDRSWSHENHLQNNTLLPDMGKEKGNQLGKRYQIVQTILLETNSEMKLVQR